MRGEEGFTLTELMVALAIGMVTILAAFQALERFGVTHATITARSDNTQRARLEMDGLIRALRSEVCTGPGGPALQSGTPTTVTFVTDLGDGTTAPEKRTVAYDATARLLRESRYQGSKVGGVLTFGATAAAGPTLANVEPSTAGGPIFTYYGYDAAVPPRPEQQLTTPLAPADLAKVARITVAFRVGAQSGRLDRDAGATLSDEVLLRSVDPADPVPLPLCS